MIHNDRFFKLEMLILAILNQRDCTSEELTSFLHFQNTLSIKEGVVLTSLFFFLESHLITQYKRDNHTYYHIESAGTVRLDTLKRRYLELKEVIKDIRSRFPLLGKQEKAFLIYLQEMLQEFETHHPDYKCDDYYEQFGIPETIIAAYYEHIESEFIINHMKVRKIIKRIGIFLITIFLLTATFIIYTYYRALQEIQESQITYEETIIEDYGEVVED